MTQQNLKKPEIGNGEALRRLGQIALDFYDASSCVWEARAILEKANRQWLDEHQLEGVERDTPAWEQMTQATAAELDHLVRMKTRRGYVQSRLLKRAAVMVGDEKQGRSDQGIGVVGKKLALLDLQKKIVDPRQLRALDKRRLSAALSDAGVSRSVCLQICRDYFGPPGQDTEAAALA
ncbi:MAG: hypothetical protein RR779_15350 [Comamonas sp.]